MEEFVVKDGKKLRLGYTTGSCAAAAAKAAAWMLLTGKPRERVSLVTPKGIALDLNVLETQRTEKSVRCAIRKDSGDDPDVTKGTLIFAEVSLSDKPGILIDGGEGVGRVTKRGLDQPVGAAAINSVPRRMIRAQVQAACAACGYGGGMAVTIFIPGGEALAARTFNPRLGVEGGLSVIGTTGIVEPMSSAALVDTIKLELNVLREGGATGVLLCPGRYGEAFCRDALGLSMRRQVSVGNFIGEALDAAVGAGFERILLVGHVGKLVKLGIGMLNTHSANGDGRMETLAACALEAGGEAPLLRRVLGCATTDAALDALDEAGLLEASMAILGARIQSTLRRRVPVRVAVGFICFTSSAARQGVLAQSENAAALAGEWRA